MLSKYSVKKPYTVVVAIVLVLILGGVSLTKMRTDLLPSMNLPYAVVMTTYAGASPETVELAVTRPIEQSMATVSNIENVSSSSRENVSVVILEFAERANMDAATIEMREKLDQISGYWDDAVGKPVIMKLNPDRMPVMVAAVEIDDMEAPEVTDYTETKVRPELESIAGVASVSATGAITEDVEVFIRSEKVDQMNQKAAKALEGTFAEKERELSDAEEEIRSGKEEIRSGREDLAAGRDEMLSKFGEGEAKLDAGRGDMIKGETTLDLQISQLETKEKELADSKAQLLEGRTKAEEGLLKLNETKQGLETLEAAREALLQKQTELSEGLLAAREGLAAVEAELLALEETLEAPGYEQSKEALLQKQAELAQQIERMETALGELSGQQDALSAQLSGILEALGQQDADAAAANLDEQIETVQKTLSDLEEKEMLLFDGETQLKEGREKLLAAREQLLSGKGQMDAAAAELSAQKLLASIEMSVAQAKMDSGDAALETAQKQLDDGREKLEDAKEQAKDASNLKRLLTPELIKGILAGENFSMPAGYVNEDGTDYLVRVGEKLPDTDALENLVILDLHLEDLEPIRLKDVADVNRTDNSGEIYAKVNGHPGVMLSMEKQTGYSTGEVTDKLLERIAQLEEENPKLHVSVLMDQGIYIDLVVDSVLNNMYVGAALAVLVLLLFLKDLKPTLVIACSIPISVVAAFVLMYFSGITLNVISLSGLALGIGMLVDNSIVVIENIYRMRREGVPAKQAAVEGARQVAGAIGASTLTTICVFAPIVFTEGITRQLFVDMGLTIAYSLLSSLVVALTLVPMMSAKMLRRTKEQKTPLWDKIQDAYRASIAAALRWKALVLLAAVVCLAGSVWFAVRKGTAFMPEMESTQAMLTVKKENAAFDELTECADQVINKIANLDDIESIGAMAGGGGMLGMGGSEDAVSMYLVLKEEKELSGEDLKKEILKRTEKLPCEVEVRTQSMDMSALGGSGIEIRVSGRDLDVLQRLAKEIAAETAKVEGTANISDGLEKTDTEYRIVVDKTKAMAHGLTVAQVFQEINGRIAEAKSATTLSTAEKDYSVYVRSDTDEELTRERLKELEIEGKDKEGKSEKLKIRELADFEEAVSPQSISRDGQTRYFSVRAELADGYNIGLVSEAVQKRLDRMELPKGYEVTMKGEDETIWDAMGQLMLMLVLALVFMYLIMVAQFQSLLSPFIIMFTIPLAFTGGFLGLLAADMEVSVIAMIGFVMLSGIIVNNGIVMVDYTNQLRKSGMEKRAALAQAGRDRLRPIIMTALTTILGLSSMAAGRGMGAGMVQPMAVVTIGGLLYGTLLTLYVVPCIYDLLNKKEYRQEQEETESTDE